MRQLVSLLAACVAFNANAGWVRWDWSPSPGVTAVKSGCVAPGQYERAPVPIVGATAGSVTINGFPESGKCYLAFNAGPQDEWIADFTAQKGGPASPGPVGNLSITWTPTPPSSAVTVSFVLFGSNNLDALTISAAADVKLTLAGGAQFDWVRAGTATGALVSTTPALGADDTVKSATVTIRGPGVFHADVDGSAFAGATATIAGASKSFTNQAGVWRVTF